MNIQFFFSHKLNQVGVIRGHDLYRISKGSVVRDEISKVVYTDTFNYRKMDCPLSEGILIGLVGREYYRHNILIDQLMDDCSASVHFVRDFLLKHDEAFEESMVYESPKRFYFEIHDRFKA